MLAGRHVDLSVIAEIDCAAVVFRIGVERILVNDELAARNCASQRGVGREPGQPVVVGISQGVIDVKVVVCCEVGVELDVVEALLHAGRSDVAQLQEGCRIDTGVWRLQHFHRAGELDDQQPAVRQEGHRRRQVEAGGQDLVHELAGVGDIDGDRGRDGHVASRVTRACGQRMRAVARRARVPRQRVGRSPCPPGRPADRRPGTARRPRRHCRWRWR